ncbi:MAG: hypothetical protein HY779_04760 [Rubrobacteridae bacterium]|nr:hypothetical protein [Rubrobacteridae bacterium]
MISLQTIHRKNVTLYEKTDNNVLSLWKLSILSRRTKVYAVDYTGRNFILTSRGESIRGNSQSVLRSA